MQDSPNFVKRPNRRALQPSIDMKKSTVTHFNQDIFYRQDRAILFRRGGGALAAYDAITLLVPVV
jgi:hypothetical protein